MQGVLGIGRIIGEVMRMKGDSTHFNDWCSVQKGNENQSNVIIHLFSLDIPPLPFINLSNHIYCGYHFNI